MLFHKEKPFKCFYGEYENIEKKTAVYKGIQAIDTNKIVGTVGRCHDSENNSWKNLMMSSRFLGIKRRMEQLKSIPPIKVYKVGEEYYIIDGHHRVMASRELDKRFLDAEVLEINNFTKKKNADYNTCPGKDFEEKTGIEGIILDSKEKYNQLLEYIKKIGGKLSDKLSLKEKAKLWYDKDFLPFINKKEKSNEESEAEKYCKKKINKDQE